jgi:hypothetical protein
MPAGWPGYKTGASSTTVQTILSILQAYFNKDEEKI